MDRTERINMELGRKYRIWYKDDVNQTRERSVTLLKKDDQFIEYHNLKTGKTEGIRKDMLLRYEGLTRDGIDKYGKTKK